MSDADRLTPADPKDLADALAFAALQRAQADARRQRDDGGDRGEAPCRAFALLFGDATWE